MKKEFNLSEKIDRTFTLWTGGYVPTRAKGFNKDIKEDVKEFIKRLKEIWTIKFIDFEKKEFHKGLLDEQIDKLAGDDLK